jgi:hypothetical protein
MITWSVEVVCDQCGRAIPASVKSAHHAKSGGFELLDARGSIRFAIHVELTGQNKGDIKVVDVCSDVCACLWIENNANLLVKEMLKR